MASLTREDTNMQYHMVTKGPSRIRFGRLKNSQIVVLNEKVQGPEG